MLKCVASYLMHKCVTGCLAHTSSVHTPAKLNNNLVEAHCYGIGMAGQFLNKHVAVKQVESKTFRP